MTINEKDVVDVFRQNLAQLLDRDDYSRTEFARRVDVTVTTVSNWLNGDAMPGMRKIQEISHVFGVPITDLIGDASYYSNLDTQRIADAISKDKDLRLLFDAARNVSADDLKAIHQIITSMKQREEGGDGEDP